MPVVSVSDGRYQRLLEHLRGLGPLAVAFSGGADSALLLAAAKDALGDGVLALTAVGPQTPRWEVGEAVRVARALEVPHRQVPIPLLESLWENPPERCYLCKRALLTELLAEAAAAGFTKLAEGTNRDDLSDYRPGARAVAELGVLSPLLACGLDKGDVRELSRGRGLPTWDKPAYACLLTRLPHGSLVTEGLLRSIDAAEAELMGRGYAAVRVRVHADIARIEVPAEQVGRLAGEAPAVARALRALGFRYVTLDLEGYRRGNLNVEGA
jgi:uncharacterized protein